MTAEALLNALPGRKIVADDVRILTVDIERLPGLAWVFDQKTKFVHHSNFIMDPMTVCVSARWYGTGERVFLSHWEHGREGMLAGLWDLYDEADVVVSFNGIRFDNSHIAEDWLTLDMGDPSPWKDVDLYAVLRRRYPGMLSKSLDYITRKLGREGKSLHYDRVVALKAVLGDRDAQEQLQAYNEGDTELTEWLSDRLRGYMPQHPVPPSSLNPDGEPQCNQCLSTDLEPQAKPYRAIVMDYPMFRCRNCRGWVRGAWSPVRFANVRGVV